LKTIHRQVAIQPIGRLYAVGLGRLGQVSASWSEEVNERAV
jgi:hypothetical protein